MLRINSKADFSLDKHASEEASWKKTNSLQV